MILTERLAGNGRFVWIETKNFKCVGFTLSLQLCAMKTQEPGNEPSQEAALRKDVRVCSLQYPNVPLSEANEKRLLSFLTE